jgi:hypothetical protein
LYYNIEYSGGKLLQHFHIDQNLTQ